MRKVTYGAACSLDGFIARRDHSVDWLRWSSDVQRLSGAYWKRVDTILMGRKTYEVARASGSAAYPLVTTYVFSMTIDVEPQPKVRLVREPVDVFVRNIKAKTGGEICVLGGGELAHSLIVADLIDEVGVNIHPVLLGDGVPLFHRMEIARDLELIQSEQIAHGCTYLLYRLVK